ncbi:uncharacterized protein LOC102709308 isoform X2 [Oryza brachyantha]|uniref:uncharacterized protein LOC102709308 isoform X2 n=1 Tax=Oryza brachyantha TaxID=4533 RepID=UPI0003EA98F9|nr:uncharacterized protein LOC102709308 isoform X2 [Oryza brachyantha]
MGLDESQKHLLGLSYHELQSLCKQYNLPANKSHSQLASSLALFLEKGRINASPEKKTPASLVVSPSLLLNAKEVSTRCQGSHKRGPQSERDDVDRPILQVKHHKGPQTSMDETLKKSDSGTRVSSTPVSTNNGKIDCFSHSPSAQGIISNVHSQIADGIGKNSGTQEHPIDLDSTVKADDEISPESSFLAPNVGENVTDTGSGLSDKIPATTKSSFEFFVMSDEGLDLFVDLNSTPSMLLDSLKKEVFIPSNTYRSEPGNFSHFASSLATKDDSNKSMSSSGNITVDIQTKGDGSIALCTNSSLGSTGADNSSSEPYLPDATAVNSMPSASTLPDTSLEISVSQEGVPVVSSSCLTSMTANALNNEVLPQESVVFSRCPEINHAPLADDSTHPTSNKETVNPVKIGCIQNVVVADTDRDRAFSSGGVVRSDSNANCSPTSEEKHKIINVTDGAHLTHNGNAHEVILENEPVETVPADEDIGCHDRLSISCQLARQTSAKPPATDARSEASSAEHCIAGSFKPTSPTPSPAASDNAFSSKHGAESAQSSAYKMICDPDELEELESTTPPSAEPPRNILLSLRSASAKQTKPASLPRRSARLVPK